MSNHLENVPMDKMPNGATHYNLADQYWYQFGIVDVKRWQTRSPELGDIGYKWELVGGFTDYMPDKDMILVNENSLMNIISQDSNDSERYIEASDGSTARYYELPEGSTELQHLISDRDMNAQVGEIFRACYRYGRVQHSEMLRDAKKIAFYAKAEIERLEKIKDAD